MGYYHQDERDRAANIGCLGLLLAALIIAALCVISL